jgi:hypothetical protein
MLPAWGDCLSLEAQVDPARGCVLGLVVQCLGKLYKEKQHQYNYTPRKKKKTVRSLSCDFIYKVMFLS